MSIPFGSPRLFKTPQTPGAPTVYSAFANKPFVPEFICRSPADSFEALVERVKLSSPSPRSMIVIAPAPVAGWSPVSGHNAILIGVSVSEVRRVRGSIAFIAFTKALKARLASGGKAGVLLSDSYNLDFNHLIWVP